MLIFVIGFSILVFLSTIFWLNSSQKEQQIKQMNDPDFSDVDKIKVDSGPKWTM